MTQLTEAKGYVDGDYLRMLADLFKAPKERTYAAMHVQPGHRVIDVGCGPGADTIPLGSLVGSSGRVVGVDHDQAMLAAANQRAAQAGCAGWVQHLQGNATALPVESNSFDAARCERVFQHIVDPTPALAEMIRVVRPGGWVVAFDGDYASVSIDAPDTDLERRITRYMSDQLINNGYVGRRMYGMFKRQGLTDVTVEVCPIVLTRYGLIRYIGRLDVLEQGAVAAGVVTQTEVERWRKSLEAAEAAGTSFSHVNMVLVAGRKP